MRFFVAYSTDKKTSRQAGFLSVVLLLQARTFNQLALIDAGLARRLIHLM